MESSDSEPEGIIGSSNELVISSLVVKSKRSSPRKCFNSSQMLHILAFITKMDNSRSKLACFYGLSYYGIGAIREFEYSKIMEHRSFKECCTLVVRAKRLGLMPPAEKPSEISGPYERGILLGYDGLIRSDDIICAERKYGLAVCSLHRWYHI